jgi:hypothetical protein
MRPGILALLAAACLLASRRPELPFDPLSAIEEFDSLIQQRLSQPKPNSLGMSRLMVRPSFGHHFRPLISDKRDFAPENADERRVVALLERHNVQLGLFLFGESVERQDPVEFSFRALNGPGIVTAGTPRPVWYPILRIVQDRVAQDGVGEEKVRPERPDPDPLPDWNQVYSLAQRGMQSFRDGGRGFETTHGSWTIAVRPALATDQRCVSCHNNSAYRPPREFRVGDALGGVLYAYRIKAITSPASASTY